MAAESKNNAVIPLAVVILALLAVIGFLLFANNDEPKQQATPTPTPTKTPTNEVVTVKGSGNAPDDISITEVSFARSVSALAIVAEVPGIDTKKLEKIEIFVNQGSERWTLATQKDPRGSFASPRLTVTGAKTDGEYACAKAAVKLSGIRLTGVLPLGCLLEQDKDFKAGMRLTNADGAVETTPLSKTIASVSAPE